MLTFGALLTCAAILALAQSALVFRNPARPNWTSWVWAEEGVATLIVCAFVFGIGAVIAGAFEAYSAGVSLVDTGLAVGLVALFVWTWRRLDLRRRLKALDARPADGAFRPAPAPTMMPAGGGALAHAAPVAPGDPPPPQPKSPTRRAA
jgi:hypothetical protein